MNRPNLKLRKIQFDIYYILIYIHLALALTLTWPHHARLNLGPSPTSTAVWAATLLLAPGRGDTSFCKDVGKILD